MAKGIYKRGNIYWIRYAGLDGRTIYESSGSFKFRDAETLLIQRKQLIKEDKEPEIPIFRYLAIGIEFPKKKSKV
ncbi:MAG: hypothetical protein AB1630_12275 [bacterium]